MGELVRIAEFTDRLVPQKPTELSDKQAILAASGMPPLETASRLRQVGLRLDSVADVARVCQGDPKRFWELLEAAVDTERFEAAKATVRRALSESGPVAMLDRSWPELLRMLRRQSLRDVLRSWSGESLLVLGPSGAGKSALLVALCIREAKDRKWVEWCSGRSLLQSQRRHPLGQGDPHEYERARDARMLVVDDPDWTRQADADQLFSELCAERERSARPTLVASGATLEEFTARYGSAVLRRIRESSRDAHGKPTGRVVSCHA